MTLVACTKKLHSRPFVRTALHGWGIRERADDIRLCVSELATNALLSGVTP
ncbi:hypothetical protein [Streptomyces aureocirculatus]|uniref:hypothetical protein n=1 Tax=Streptomyces aureocirculatus TaxID=67275 RepID=UPI000AD435F3|nr:hypothetical protein [Streptomyces aureocirculatus]